MTEIALNKFTDKNKFELFRSVQHRLIVLLLVYYIGH